MITGIIKSNIKYFILLVILCSASCEKEQLKVPTNLYVEFAIINPLPDEKEITEGLENEFEPDEYEDANLDERSESEIFDEIAGHYFFSIDTAVLNLSNIHFNAEREEGEDYIFNTNYKKPLVVDLTSGETNKELKFDFPQGIYKKIELQLETETAARGSSGMLVKGKYYASSGEKMPIEFHFFDSTEIIDFIPKSKDPSLDTLVMKEGKITYIEIQLNIEYLFRNMKGRRFEDVRFTEEKGRRKLIIADTLNAKLYYDLVDRTEEAIQAVYYQK